MSNPPCRVCGRALDDCGTCVCATRHAAPVPPVPCNWLTEEEANVLRAALYGVRRLRRPEAAGPATLAYISAYIVAASVLANAVEELLVELPRRRIRSLLRQGLGDDAS